MSGKLESRVVLVTGASRGIGAAIARRFAAEGASVVIAARTLEPAGDSPVAGSLQETADAIRAAGGSCLPVATDLSNPDDRARLIAEAEREYGFIDVLVNNAAVGMYIPTMQQTRKRLWLSYEVNVMTPVDLMQRTIDWMRERGAGWVLNISSASSASPGPAPWDDQDRYVQFHRQSGPTVYASTKAALERLTTGTAAELGQDNVNVNTLAPVEAVASEGAMHADVIDEVAQFEPVEAMAEAALALCTGTPGQLSGRCVLSLPFLEEQGIKIKTLDGKTTIE